jgi:hypothetical protein
VESRLQLLFFDFDEIDDSFGSVSVENTARPANHQRRGVNYIDVEHLSIDLRIVCSLRQNQRTCAEEQSCLAAKLSMLRRNRIRCDAEKESSQRCGAQSFVCR